MPTLPPEEPVLDAKGKPKPPPKKKVGREGTRSSNRTTRPSKQAGQGQWWLTVVVVVR